MKSKSIILSALFSLPLLVTACGEEASETPLSENYETYIGEIQSLGGLTVDESITHLFETEDGEILYAYSGKYDLFDQEYSEGLFEVYGKVMEYESIDKPVFDIQRITLAEIEDVEETEAMMVDYKDTLLGVSIRYSDRWEFKSLRDSIQLIAPLSEEDLELGLEADYIVFAQTELELSKGSDEKDEVRKSEIDQAIGGLYGYSEGKVTYIGEDLQWAVRYESEAGDISYFIPRGAQLLELSFFHPSETENYLDNKNAFADLVLSFRFLPYGEESEETNVEAPPSEQETDSGETELPEVDQVSVDEYRSFESNPYHFEVSYPSQWYYSGGITSGVYGFSDEPIEDGVTPKITLDIDVASQEGVSVSGSETSVTVEVEGHYYTLSGSSEYASVMQEMARSINAIENDEA